MQQRQPNNRNNNTAEEALRERFKQKSRAVLEEKIPGTTILGEINVNCRCHLCHEDVQSKPTHWKSLIDFTGECFKCESNVSIETAFLNRERQVIASVTPECTADELLSCLQAVAKYRYGDPLNHSPPITAPPALATTILKGTTEEVERLVNPLNINCLVERGMTALFFACYHGKKEMVECLLNRGADVHAKSKDAMRAMHAAISGKNVEIVKLLHAKGARVNDIDANGFSPLHHACMEGQLDICKFLLDKGAEVNRPSMVKTTPLHLAARSGNRAIVSLLMGRGAPIDPVDMYGRTPLALAFSSGMKEAGRALLDGGASLLCLKGTIPDWAGGEAARVIATKNLRIAQLQAHMKALQNGAPQQSAPTDRRFREVEEASKAAHALCKELEKKSKDLEAQVETAEDRSVKFREQLLRAQEINKGLQEEKKKRQQLENQNKDIETQNMQCGQKIKALRQELGKLEKAPCEAIQIPWQKDEDDFNQRWQKTQSELREAGEMNIDLREKFGQRLNELETLMAKVKLSLAQSRPTLSNFFEQPSTTTQEPLTSRWLKLQNAATELQNAENATLIQQRALELYPHLESLHAELKNLTSQAEKAEDQPSISLQ